jgi:peroxiredoxin
MSQTNVRLVGRAENAVGKRVELYCYDDMLSQTEHLMDDAVVGEDGTFALGCYANYPRLVFLQVECYSQAFYIEPGRTYNVLIPEFDWTQDEQRNINLDPVALPLLFTGLPDDELNVKIGDYERVRDSFIVENRMWFDFKYKPQRRWFDTMVTVVERAVPDGGNAFFARYREYTLAEMRYAMGFATRRQLYNKYIKDEPVLYHDENYMRLFLTLFEGTISKGSKYVPLRRLREWVEKADLHTYLDSLGLDPMLLNEQVRELAALQALGESYYDGHYSREGVRRMVEQLGRETKFPEHRKLAERLDAKMLRMEEGEEMPLFELPDVEHRPVDLSELRGKWVYLSFVRVGDPNCLREIETMAHFRDTVYAKNPDVVFVSVCCDREFQKMYHFLKTSKRGARYNWLWLHFDGNYRLLERYGVVSYPTFLLINPKGQLQYSVTPPPASGILLHGPWEAKADVKESGGGFKFENR